ncbi:hypothetical protein CASFOL_006854 [Castilleja foliolosa]|uniref:Uncharacterized protein n=1 Tax=Castilleja foliolosa TaxID=1961234 RepID=A0ABD3E7N7_9LAMI
MAGATMDSELPMEPQSLKKLSFKSLKRALDLYFRRLTQKGKKIRVSHKLNPEYGGVKAATESSIRTAAAKSRAQQNSTPSNVLALSGPDKLNDIQKGGLQKDLAISSTGQSKGPGLLMLVFKAGARNCFGSCFICKVLPFTQVFAKHKNLSTSAIMERIPSRWPRPVWHAPWKNYRK